MNRLLLNKDNERKKIDDSRFFEVEATEIREHLLHHLKVNIGSSLKVTLLNEGLATGEVTAIKPELIEIKVSENSITKGLHFPINLVIASSRPPTVKKILEHGASLGIEKISFFTAELSEKSYLASKIFEERKIRELTELGLAQSACFYKLPLIERYHSLEQALEVQKEDTQKFTLSLEKGQRKTFLDYPINFSHPITLAIGPERGWTKKEEDLLKEFNFKGISLSPSVLRVEIATFVALAQLAMLRQKD